MKNYVEQIITRSNIFCFVEWFKKSPKLVHLKAIHSQVVI